MSIRTVHVVRGLIINQSGSFPLLLRNYGELYGCLQLPGGVVEGIANEMPVSEGYLIGELMREVREELGIDINFSDWKRIQLGVVSKVFNPGEFGHRKDISTDPIRYTIHYFVARTDQKAYHITPEENHKFSMLISADFNKVNRFCQLLEKMEDIIDDRQNKINITLDTGLVESLRAYSSVSVASLMDCIGQA